MAVTAALSPNSLPQSSTGRLEVSKALIAPHHDLQSSSAAVTGSSPWPWQARKQALTNGG